MSRAIFQSGQVHAEEKVLGLVSALRRAGVIVEVQSAFTPHLTSRKNLAGATYLLDVDIVVLFDDEPSTAYILSNKTRSSGVTVVIVESATLNTLATSYLPFRDSVRIVERRALENADVAARIVEELLQAIRTQEQAAVARDRLIEPDKTEDSSAYRERASWDPVVPVMARFLSELRSAIRPMKAPIPSLPWDPDDSSGSVRVQDGAGDWTLGDHVGPVGVTDLFYANSHKAARESFRFYPSDAETKKELQWFGKPPHLLLTGASGTGKTMVASFIRDVLQNAAVANDYLSKFQDRDGPPQMPFVEVNCAALEFDNVVHLLHGSAPNAWTQAVNVGAFVRGAYGVIFFDELGDLSYNVQRALLTFLEDRTVRPVGMPPFPSFARIVAATNRDLPAMVRRGEFRHDLLARFARHVSIPSLAERGEADRERLAMYAAANPSVNGGGKAGSERPVTHISRSAMEKLREHEYADGNYRDLEASVHRAIESAMRDGSKVVRPQDVRLPGAEFTSERARNIVMLAPRTTISGDPVVLASIDELERIAAAIARPMLREPTTGDLYLLDEEIVYTCPRPTAVHDEQSPILDAGSESAER